MADKYSNILFGISEETRKNLLKFVESFEYSDEYGTCNDCDQQVDTEGIEHKPGCEWLAMKNSLENLSLDQAP